MNRLFPITLLIITLNGGSFIAYGATDQEKLNPQIASFYRIDEQAYATDNGYIGLLGVNAPATIRNTYDWALQLLQSGKGAAAWDAVADKTFEHYDMPGMKREGDIHIAGPMKNAWCKDPDGNILSFVSVG